MKLNLIMVIDFDNGFVDLLWKKIEGYLFFMFFECILYLYMFGLYLKLVIVIKFSFMSV